MKIYKTNVYVYFLDSCYPNKEKVKIMDFYTTKEPSKEYIKEKIELHIGSKLKIQDMSPKNGGDFGAFFYWNEAYVTYDFTLVIVDILD